LGVTCSRHWKVRNAHKIFGAGRSKQKRPLGIGLQVDGRIMLKYLKINTE